MTVLLSGWAAGGVPRERGRFLCDLFLLRPTAGQAWSSPVVILCIATQSSMTTNFWRNGVPAGRFARAVREGHFGQSGVEQDQGHAGLWVPKTRAPFMRPARIREWPSMRSWPNDWCVHRR
jgi:hypothetical protein